MDSTSQTQGQIVGRRENWGEKGNGGGRGGGGGMRDVNGTERRKRGLGVK